VIHLAQVAYELERFAPSPARKPAVRVVRKPREEQKPKGQIAKMVRTLLAALVVVVLVFGVLATQTSLNELQRGITSANKELTEQEALYAHLNFELENMTSMKNVEERAAELGLEKVSGGQVNYFRAEAGNTIEVKENPFTSLFKNLADAINSLFGGDAA